MGPTIPIHSLKACGLTQWDTPEYPRTKLKPKNGDDIFEQRKQLKLNKGIEERSIKIQEKTDLLYARDTAKKIKSTFRMKGESGKHLTTNPLFGFVKDAEDKDKWLIDEEAAQTVRYIFKLCYDGFGTTQIAKKLKTEKVLTPTAYKAQKDGKLLPAEPYKWA